MDVSTVKKQSIYPLQQPKRPEPTQRAQAQAEKPYADKKTEEPKPRPVINSQGQTTGQRLNVTA